MSPHVPANEALIPGSSASNVRVCLTFAGDLPKKSMCLPMVCGLAEHYRAVGSAFILVHEERCPVKGNLLVLV